MDTDNERRLEHLACIWLRDNISSNFKCFVVAPQFEKRPANYQGENGTVTPSHPSPTLGKIIALIEEVEKTIPISIKVEST